MKPFNLEDLDPRACDLELTIEGETKIFRLRKFNLLAQIWVRREWGSEKTWEEALNPKSEVNQKSGGADYLEALLKTLHYLLEDKARFPTWEHFAQELGAGVSDLENLGKALLTVMGLSSPAIEALGVDGKKKNRAARRGQSGTR